MDASTPDLTGQTLGDFRVVRRLGQGGMGQVYLAEQISLRRKVALKILRADLARDPAALQRFQAEAEAVARFTHANVVQVYAIGEANGLHYMALEYVEGRNLRDYLARKGSPDLPVVFSIMRQVAAALQRAGEAGLIHRDIKPENILITRAGEVKVADFGLSRCFMPDQAPLSLTQTGVTMGTPLYMSPEQVEGKSLDPRTDIYSFGVTCYHMLAGQPPFRGETAFEVAVKHVRDEPVPLQQVRPDLPPGLCELVQRMMAKEPAQRVQTCRDLLRELTRLQENVQGPGAGPEAVPPIPGISTSLPSLTPAPADRSVWRGVAMVGSVLAALGGGILLALGGAGSPPTEPSQPAPAVAEDGARTSLQTSEREQFLKQAVLEYANPGGNQVLKRVGLDHAVELSLIYLEQWRLDEAHRFFTELIENKHRVREYVAFGRLGRAVVLAFQNRPAESNKIFLELLGERPAEADKAMERYRQFLLKPQLRQMIARALEYNVANATAEAPFPSQLDYLRRPPPPLGLAGPRKGPDKGPNKNP
jgi:serine/threonine-protein kinase